MKWKDEAPAPISTLSGMFINRNLLKACDISSLNNIEKLETLAFAREECNKNNFDPNLFCGIKEKKFSGFESNNSLKVWDGNFLGTLDQYSSLIKTLMKTEGLSLLIIPDCIRKEVYSKILSMRNK